MADSNSLRIDYRVVAIASFLFGLSALVALIVTSDASGVEQTALVLAVVAFGADLIIALVSYMIASQAEARLSETNGAMQSTLVRIDEQASEIRNLTRLNTRDLLEMVSGRVLENAAPADRDAYQRALGEVMEEVKEAPLLKPPLGGKRSRQERLRAALGEWVDRKGFPRIANPSGIGDGAERFEADGVIYLVQAYAGRLTDTRSPYLNPYVDALRDDWPDREVRKAILIEEPELSGWDGRQWYETRIVTTANLDDILREPPRSDEETGFIPETDPRFLPRAPEGTDNE